MSDDNKPAGMVALLFAAIFVGTFQMFIAFILFMFVEPTSVAFVVAALAHSMLLLLGMRIGNGNGDGR